MRRLLIVLGTVGGVLGLWFVMYQRVALPNPAPLDPQPYPHGTLEAPTPVPVVRHVNYDELVQQVVPAAGMTIPVRWGDMGQRLIEAGAIDLGKFERQYGGLSPEQQAIVQGDSSQEITFTLENIQFWTNVLWSLGLTQQSDVLGEGPMMQNAAQAPLGNYASTGGWTLGSQNAVDLYNSAQLLTLTPQQNDLVYQVAENIFRPCCGNPTSFPDCNHGMAVLGLVELMASQGASEQELYRAALTFNSYAFPDTYITLAAYFAGQDTVWADVDPAAALGSDYSSGRGAQRVAALVGPIPGSPDRGGSCST
jgi:hypothetical protein